jgi:predicted XRE-type DNA-binding protein
MKARKLVRFGRDLPRSHWMRRAGLPANASLRGYAEDHAVSQLVSLAGDAIAAHGMTRKEVAELLGTTKSNVSQFLNGSRNMTIKTFGALLWTCGWLVDVTTVRPVGSERGWKPRRTIRRQRPRGET